MTKGIYHPLIWVTVTLIAIQFLNGCATSSSRNPIPETLSPPHNVYGIAKARSWGDETPLFVEEWMTKSSDELKAQYSGIIGKEHNYLAISGGGANGAYGAGLLVGWTAAGTRPEFTWVTGISTGALIAPFAFLGPAYDDQLREVYTTHSTNDFLNEHGFFEILKVDSFADTRPLKALIEKYFNDEMMQAIAAEHRKGRGLEIGTTNLDAARPVVWNITRIAASGHPKALKLIQQILLASASIPVAFPPVYIQIDVDGQVYDEMHVDGGATSQVFSYPPDFDMAAVIERFDVQGTPKLYIIRNSWIGIEWETVKPKLSSIAGRTAKSFIRTQGIGDMYRMYHTSLRDGIEYNLSYIPHEIENEAREPFDQVFMGKLFDRGYQKAKNGYPWENKPPGASMD